MSSERITLRDYVRILFRRKGIIILTVLTVVLSAYIGLQLQTPVYTAEVKVLISGAKETGAVYYKNMGVDDTEIANTQTAMVISMPVLTRTVNALHLDEVPADYEKQFASPLKKWLIDKKTVKFNEQLQQIPENERKAYLFNRAVDRLRSKIEVELLRHTNIFAIRVQDFDPKQAATIANVISRAYVIFDLQQQLAELQLKYGDQHPIMRQLEDNIRAMGRNLSGEPLSELEAIGPATVKIIEQAYPPLRPVSTPKTLTMLLALVLGSALAVISAIAMDYLDQTIKTPQDAQRILKIPPLGSIPRKRFWERAIFKHLRSKSPYARTYRHLAEQIGILAKEKKAKVLLFTSTEQREGTTSVVANTGFLMANYSHKDVLIIDVNMRHPTLHACFRQKRQPGLVEVFKEEKDLTDVLHKVSGHLQLLSCGHNGFNPALVLDSARMGEFLTNLKAGYDFILLDCANLKDHKDAIFLAEHVDGVVVVIRENQTNRHTIENIIRSFNHINSKLIGFVFNKRTFAIPKFIYERV